MSRHFLVNPTWRCQNRCSYCWMRQTVALRPDLYDAPERSAEDWYGALKRDRPEVVDIAGGEPLLLDWVPDLMRVCRSIAFGLSTNGLHAGGIEDLCRSRIPNLIAINVSYHPETNAPDYQERFRDAVLRLRGAGYHVHSNLVATPQNLRDAHKARLLYWLEEHGIPYEVSPNEQMDYLGAKLDQGLLCQGGVNHLTVAPDGTAWPCLTTLRSPYWRETALGNWIDGTVDIGRKEQPCHLNCVDWYVLPKEHSAGDMWKIEARPAP